MEHPSSTPQSPGSDHAQSRRSALRSCYGCNSKKIRCDKDESCSACLRAGIPCVYPPVGPRKRRTKNNIIADMTSRLSTLEKSIAKDSAGRPVRPKTQAVSEPQILTAARIEQEAPGEHLHVDGESSSQYFGEILMTKAIREVSSKNIENNLTPPHTQVGTPCPPIYSLFSALGILSSPSFTAAPASFHPSKELSSKLWRRYLENIEGCIGLKLLHTPTDQVKVYSTIDDPEAAPLDNLALNYAIYFASMVSVEDSEAQVILKGDKSMLLLQCKSGLEQSFAHGGLLDQPTLAGIHALAIYLMALRTYNRGKGLWILNGLLIRMAQTLGIHRDGERLGLSPFQSEIRRRLWWHLLTRDGRAGEDYGLENVHGLLLMSDTRLPSNLDDNDIYPEMKALPAEKEGWTVMTCSIVNIDLTKCMQKLATLGASPNPPSESTRAEILRDLKVSMDKGLVYCNRVIPEQRATLYCCRLLHRKLDFITRLQWILLDGTKAQAEFTTEENLEEALEILELRLYKDDDILRQFSWTRRAYPQYYVTMYILWHLCAKPEGPNVERAWNTVDAVFSPELWDDPVTKFGSKSAVLTGLKSKALLERDRVRALHPERNAVTNTIIQNAAIGQEPSNGDDFSGQYNGGMSEDLLNFGNGMDEWPAWDALVQGFQLDAPLDAFWQ